MSLKNLFRIEVSHYTTQRGGGLSKLEAISLDWSCDYYQKREKRP